MEWTQLRAECALCDLETVTAVMSMIDNSLMIEDYSDVADGMNAIYGELLDEEIINKDKTRGAVSVYLSEERNVFEISSLLRERLSSLGISADISTVGIKEEDWADCWKQYYKPLHIGRNVVIVPAWEEYKASGSEVIVKIDPGMAFGTGTHETTALCAEMIEKYLTAGDRVLDVGTGSGILAVLASKLSAREVDARDIDPSAVKAAKENCEFNNAGNVRCMQSDLIASAEGVYDLISANIVADIIIRMSENTAPHLKRGGKLIVSGIIEPQSGEVIDAFVKKGFALRDRADKNDWNSFVFEKL